MSFESQGIDKDAACQMPGHAFPFKHGHYANMTVQDLLQSGRLAKQSWNVG